MSKGRPKPMLSVVIESGDESKKEFWTRSVLKNREGEVLIAAPKMGGICSVESHVMKLLEAAGRILASKSRVNPGEML